MGMLILTRRVGERLMIGDDITITLLGTRRNQVRFGIEAPKGMRVDREEVRERINRQKAAEADGTAAQTGAAA